MGRDIRLLRQPELASYWRMLQLPKVIGHRGAAAYVAENTLESFREARRRGATWVETDVTLTADGVPIVMHDDSSKRTTGIDRLVAETRRADLPAEVPTFEEAIACWRRVGAGLQRRDQADRGPRGRNGACGGRDPAALLARPSAAAVAVELQGRLAGRRPRRRAGVCPRPAGRARGGRLAVSAPRPWRRAGSMPTASDSPRSRPWKSGRRATRSASTPSTTAAWPGRWSAWASQCVITDAPDVILAALG